MPAAENSSAAPETLGHVLVVDDEATSRALLRDALEAQGYRVTAAESGVTALKLAEEKPDVILLNVTEPGIDGYEVCRKLKGNPRTAPIPVLIVTAFEERKELIRIVEAGASDVLFKPVDLQETMLRVRNACYSRHMFTRLKEMENLHDELTHMIIHDMRSPLMGISGYLDLFLDAVAGKLTEDEKCYVTRARSQAAVLVEMVSSLLDVRRLESGEMPLSRERLDLRDVVRQAVEAAPVSGARQVGVETPEEPLWVSCDRDVISRVIANLVVNSDRSTPEGGTVRVAVGIGNGRAEVRVSDTGWGIPAEFLGKIFEKFGQVDIRRHKQKYSTGLGLAFCKLAVEAHGGVLGVESEVDKGSTFWFALPVAAEGG